MQRQRLFNLLLPTSWAALLPHQAKLIQLHTTNPQAQNTSEEARELLNIVSQQVDRVIGLMETFLSALGIILAILVALGLFEYNRLKVIRKKAETMLNKAMATLQDAEDSSRQVSTIKAGMVQAWGDLDSSFERLPAVEVHWVVGFKPPSIEPEKQVALQDGDSLLVLCDSLRIAAGEKKTAEYFAKIAKFWRGIENYPRAIARLERSIALHPRSAASHLELGKTLAYSAAAAENLPENAKRAILQRAREEILTAQRLQRKHDSRTLYSLAWIYDEEGYLELAIKHYKKARQRRQREASERQPNDTIITYNLACALTKIGRLDEALAELDSVIELDENWKAAEKDRDFGPLRESEVHKDRFRETISRGQQRSSPSSS